MRHAAVFFRFLRQLSAIAAFACLAAAPYARADFDDRGLVAGRVRSSYAPGVGSGAQWLTLWYQTPVAGCRFDARDPLNPFGCPGLAWRDPYGRDLGL